MALMTLMTSRSSFFVGSRLGLGGLSLLTALSTQMDAQTAHAAGGVVVGGSGANNNTNNLDGNYFDSDGDGIADRLDAFRLNANATSLQAIPAIDQYGTLIYEDLWPTQGDFDFNDVVLDHNIQLAKNSSGHVVSIRGTFYIRAHGAQNRSGLGWALPIDPALIASVSKTEYIGVDHNDFPTNSQQNTQNTDGTTGTAGTAGATGTTTSLLLAAGESGCVIDLVSDIRTTLFASVSSQNNSNNSNNSNNGENNGQAFINTDPNRPATKGALVVVNIALHTPVQIDATQAPFDLFLFDTVTPSRQIHRTRFGGTDRMDASLFGSKDDGSDIPTNNPDNRFFVDKRGVPFVLELPTTALYPQEGQRIESLYPRLAQFAESGGTQAQDFFLTPAVLHGFIDGQGIPAPFAPAAASSEIVLQLPTVLASVPNLDNAPMQTFIKAPTIGFGDVFGSSVAIDDVTGNIMVVGAPFEDSNAIGVDGDQLDDSLAGSGAAYVYIRDPETGLWSFDGYLKASNPDAEDLFGISVAVSNGVIVVGAVQEDSGAQLVDGDQTDNTATSAGAAYVFVHAADGDTNGNTNTNTNTSHWIQEAYLKASNADIGGQFGRSVAISGDVIVVGADNENGAASGVNGDPLAESPFAAGAAYIFRRTASTWEQEAYLKPHNSDFGEFFIFGASVSVSGNTVVVGAPQEDSNASGVNGDGNNAGAGSSGAAYVFAYDENTQTWFQEAYLKASNPASSDLFGTAVSISGNTIVVTATGEDSNATGINGDQNNNFSSNSGAAYVFVRENAVWSQQAYLKASNTGNADRFGAAVSIFRDSLVITATGEDSDATGINGDQNNNRSSSAGAAYGFSRQNGIWQQKAYIKNTPAKSFNTYGKSVAMAQDVLVVGISGDTSSSALNPADTASISSGACYVYDF